MVPTAAQGNPIKSGSIQFNTIPDQIFVYLARQSQDRDFSTSDTFAVINSVSVDFMNQTGNLFVCYTRWKTAWRNGCWRRPLRSASSRC